VARIKNVNKVFLHLCCRTNWQMSVCKNERKTKSRRYPRYDSWAALQRLHGESEDAHTVCSQWSLNLCQPSAAEIITSAKEVMFLPDFVCLSVCLSVCVCVYKITQKSYGRIFLKFWGYVGNGTNYQWFNFGGDPEGILDSGSLWNFRYHCVKRGHTGTAAKPKMVTPSGE